MALWCTATGQSPATWRELTRLERQAFEDVADEIREQARKRR